MPGPPPTPVASDQILPDAIDVAVIGGGIIGSATALELAEMGHRVALFEKGEIAGEQSSRNWGWVRISLRDSRELPLMMEAVRTWEGYASRLEHPTGFTRCGILFAYGDAKTRESYARWQDHLAPYQVPSEILDRKGLEAHLGGGSVPADGALYTPNDARAEPQLAAPAVAKGARARGASIFTGCAVRSLDIEAGRVTGVITEKGHVRCGAVVLAGGAWSRLFAGNAGIDLPQLKVLNTVLRTTPVDGGPETSLWTDDMAWRRRSDRGYTIADGGSNLHGITPDSFRQFRRFLPALRENAASVTPRLDGRFLQELREKRRWLPDEVTAFEQTRILDPTPDARRLKRFWARAQRAVPAFAQANIAQSWGGMIDVTPDAIPVMSETRTPGFFIATGFSGHGFGIGPGAGRLMADLVTGRTPVVDSTPYRLTRFFDGSPIILDGGF